MQIVATARTLIIVIVRTYFVCWQLQILNETLKFLTLYAS